jgi:phosphate transport system substrate-binding protein
MQRPIRVFLTLSVVLFALTACGTPATEVDVKSGLVVGDTLAPVVPATVTGPIEITGSSTVYPLTARVAEEFYAEGSRAEIDIKITGTGGGLRSFCNGDLYEIVNASRPINEREIEACRAVGREPIGFLVGIDALAVVVNPENGFAQALTYAQLQQIFTGEVTSWNELDASFPAAPIAVFSPGVDSGTFDYFVEEVLDGDGAALEALPGALLSEDDTELVIGIESNPNAIGYFGFAYYQAEGDRLRAVAIDAGNGAILPGPDTVADATYPLARPLFIYTSARDLEEHPAAAAFLSYYLQIANDVILEVGYFPPSEALATEAQRTLVAALQ